MAIKLDNFVNVNIKYHLSSQLAGNRETVVLFQSIDNKIKDTTFSSLSELKKKTSVKEGDMLYYYAYTFFANGGIKLRIIYLEATGSVYTHFANFSIDKEVDEDNYNTKKSTLYVIDTTNKQFKLVDQTASYSANITYYDKTETSIKDYTQNELEGAIKALDMEYIVIASTGSFTTMNTVAFNINKETDTTQTQIWKKKLITCMPTSATVNDLPKDDNIGDGLIIKYGILGVEMTIGAYLSKINIDYANSVQDYDYTSEKVQYSYQPNPSTTDTITVGEFYTDNELVAELMEANVNVDGELVGAVRNLGGNQLNGNDIVNHYMLILLNQTLTERLVSLLSKKVKYNATGLSLIGAEISRELQRYLNNGYLTTDKCWTEDDLEYQGITIISKNTPLKTGYKYVILPFSVLSPEDLAAHKLPPIYILVADSYGIRKINVVGEIF